MRDAVRTLFPLAVALLSFACGAEEATEQREGKGGRMYGGNYRMNEVESPRTLDPVRLNDATSHHVVHQICDLLVDFDSSLTLQPELAEGWEVSSDGLTYTYHLRRGVRFQDSDVFPGGKGREMTAHDVKYCFDRIMDARSGTSGASYFRTKVKGAADYFLATQGLPAEAPSTATPPTTDSAATAGGGAVDSAAKKPAGSDTPAPAGTTAAPTTPAPAADRIAAGVSGFRVIDDYTFAIDLIEPFAAFKFYPALGFCYIYPKEAVAKHGSDFFRYLVGTGPFRLDHWTQDREIVLTRNPSYWRKDAAGNQLPFLDKVTFTFIKDEKQQINEFSLGNLEEAYRIPSEMFRNVVDEKGNVTPEYSRFVLHKVPALSTQFYGMLTTSDVFRDKRIRQAFSYAIDRNSIIQHVLQGQAFGPAVHGIVPPSMPGYDVKAVQGYSFDLQKARALMAEAGYPNGQGFPPVTLQLNSGGGRNALVAQAAQEMLKKGLGINVSLQELEWPQHNDLIESGKAAFYRLGWIADYPDAENFLNLVYSRNIPEQGHSPINTSRYRNAEFDKIFEQALRTQDDAARNALYQQAEAIMMAEAPLLTIFNDLDYRLLQPWVRGYSSNAMDRRDLTWTWFDYSGNPAQPA